MAGGDRPSHPSAGRTALHMWKSRLCRNLANGPAIVAEAVRRVVQGFTTSLVSLSGGDSTPSPPNWWRAPPTRATPSPRMLSTARVAGSG
jgi:hypothetical protein